MINPLSATSPSFSGHESFPLRFSWLKKGFDAALKDPTFFGSDDAMVVLGTGKNMVRSIRHWGIACGTLEELPHSRGREVKPTRFGNQLLDDSGWDPFLEELGTIWLLHWRLVCNTNKATTWSWVFGRPKGNRFTREDVIEELLSLAREQEMRKPSRASVKRDVEVLVRSYTRAKAVRGSVPEDSLDSPFVLLDLIRSGIEKSQYEIVEGAHPTLPVGIFEAALAEYCEQAQAEAASEGQLKIRSQGSGQSISLDALLYGALSPGRVFRLSENALLNYLHQLVAMPGERYLFAETAGVRQLMLPKGPPKPLEVLSRFYKNDGMAN